MNNADERTRLKELLSLGILDTGKEERFERFTQLVANIFNMPVVSVTLVDEHRQWFKSTVGRQVSETPREESICSWALNQDFLEIPDAREDDFFCDHPAVRGAYGLRFYAGSVLYGPTGQPIGALCLNDFVPRRLSSVERSWLQSFAKLVQHELIRDSELEKQRRRIQDVTLRDVTTGLPGEMLLTEALDNLISIANEGGQQLAVLHLRVDNLDMAVRLHGRNARDEILQIIADRLTAPTDRILAAGRTGPARFVLVVPLEEAQTPHDIAKRVVDKLNEPMTIGDHSIRTEIDAGVCVYPNDGEYASQLIDRARTAVTDRRPSHRVHVFTHESNADAIRRHSIEAKLETAILESGLHLHFQPIYTTAGDRICAFEALARWEDPELGRVGPNEFVPIAEKSDRLSHELTVWALKTACKEAIGWKGVHGARPPRIAVNIPAREFYDPRFVKTVIQVLQETGLEPTRLTLELTEESLIQDIDQAIRTMEQLEELGIQLALDDFGTGYSSLSHLRRLPVNTLKIDKSFIADLPIQVPAVKLAEGIISIAQNLGLKVVAEGVEREDQRALLADFGCDMIQGYLLGRPVPEKDVGKLLDN